MFGFVDRSVAGDGPGNTSWYGLKCLGTEMYSSSEPGECDYKRPQNGNDCGQTPRRRRVALGLFRCGGFTGTAPSA